MTPEETLNFLRKLDENKSCVNCDTIAKFGHSNICEKFNTFVCNHCKSAHQSYSHRVKSITMSNWTKEQVDALKEENGGGNLIAKKTWLGKYNNNNQIYPKKPNENDSLDIFKKFIHAVYNNKIYYIENSNQNKINQNNIPTINPTKASSDLLGFSPASTTSSFQANFDTFSTPLPPAPIVSNSFPTFDAFSAPLPPAAPIPSKHDEWSAFQSASTGPSATQSFHPFAASPSSVSTTNSFHPFAASPSSVSTTNSFDPFASSTTTIPSVSSTSSISFDPFAVISNRSINPINTGGSFPPPCIPSQYNQYGTPNQSYQQQQFPPSYGYPQQPNNTMYNGGGASISSLLDPSMVSNTNIQRLSGNVHVGNPNQRPPQQNTGRDPFAGLAFN